MKFKNAFFLGILSIFPLVSCGNITPVTPYLKDASYKYNNGEITINFISEGIKSFDIYQKEVNESEYSYLKTIKEKSFTTTKYDASYKVVASDHILEIPSYIKGAFSSNNVYVFSPDDDHTEIQRFIDQKYINEELRSSEWSKDRVEMLFLPGDYSDITIKIGYYTSIRGLGLTPDEVLFDKLETINHPGTGNALINFWRTLENVSFKNDSIWAVSQATSIRRCHFYSNLVLSDHLGGNGWSSGGFIANTLVDGDINSGSQQQYLMRNDTFKSWSHSNMNMIFEGTVGKIPATDNWLENRTTEITNSYEIIEKPYLIFDEEKGYGFIKSNKKINSKGHQFICEDDEFISLNDFYIANPNKDDATTLNKAFSEHQYVLFTPGIYSLDEEIKVVKDDSIISGLGLATIASNSNLENLMSVDSINSIICSLLFENEAKIHSFLRIEEKTIEENTNTLLSDLFFRVGGQSHNDTSVQVCLIINQDKVIGDNFWVWRADHGNNIGFYKNYAKNGVIINGDDVIMHALLVEHFFEYQTIWNGENGTLVFYQSETPYDPPSQAYWMRQEEGLYGEELFGYPSYKIADTVNKHTAFGIGIYYINTTGVYIFSHTALECPSVGEIYLKHVSARYFGGYGQINHTINNIKGYEDEAKNLAIELFISDPVEEN